MSETVAAFEMRSWLFPADEEPLSAEWYDKVDAAIVASPGNGSAYRIVGPEDSRVVVAVWPSDEEAVGEAVVELGGDDRLAEISDDIAEALATRAFRALVAGIDRRDRFPSGMRIGQDGRPA